MLGVKKKSNTAASPMMIDQNWISKMENVSSNEELLKQFYLNLEDVEQLIFSLLAYRNQPALSKRVAKIFLTLFQYLQNPEVFRHFDKANELHDLYRSIQDIDLLRCTGVLLCTMINHRRQFSAQDAKMLICLARDQDPLNQITVKYAVHTMAKLAKNDHKAFEICQQRGLENLAILLASTEDQYLLGYISDAMQNLTSQDLNPLQVNLKQVISSIADKILRVDEENTLERYLCAIINLSQFEAYQTEMNHSNLPFITKQRVLQHQDNTAIQMLARKLLESIGETLNSNSDQLADAPSKLTAPSQIAANVVLFRSVDEQQHQFSSGQNKPVEPV